DVLVMTLKFSPYDIDRDLRSFPTRRSSDLYAAAKTWDEHELPALVEAAAGKALVLVLDGVQDPHNLGACLRSAAAAAVTAVVIRSEEHTSELQSREKLVCRLLREKKQKIAT